MKCKWCGTPFVALDDRGRHQSLDHCIEALSSRVEELEAQVKAILNGEPATLDEIAEAQGVNPVTAEVLDTMIGSEPDFPVEPFGIYVAFHDGRLKKVGEVPEVSKGYGRERGPVCNSQCGLHGNCAMTKSEIVRENKWSWQRIYPGPLCPRHPDHTPDGRKKVGGGA